MNNRFLIFMLLSFFNCESSLLSPKVGFNAIGYNINSNNSGYYKAVAFNNTTGEIVAVGGNASATLVAVYNSNGTLRRYIDLMQSADSECTDVTFNSQKMFIVGINQNSKGFLTRYTSEYTSDFYTPLDTDNSEFHGVTTDRNNKIIAVGSVEDKGLIARFNENGQLDTDFNAYGYRIENDPTIGDFIYKAAGVDSQGRIVVVGIAFINNQTYPLIIRYTSTGQVDTNFNIGGIDGGPGYINSKFDPNYSDYFSVVIDKDDRIIVAGKAAVGIGSYKGVIIRYTSAGTLDTTFGVNGAGFVLNSYGAPEQNVAVAINKVLLDSHDKIVVCGFLQSIQSAVVARHNSDGTLDTTFNDTGYAIFSAIPGSASNFMGISLDNQNKIIAVGQSALTNSFVVRYLSNGVLDTLSNWKSVDYRNIAKINNNPIGMLSA
jgi:uncharacterized delta-60 repeat protein